MQAAGLKWKDVTSYSKDDQERVPRTWEAQIGFRIGVTRKHGVPGTWFGYAYGFVDWEVQLTNGNLKQAMEEWVSRLEIKTRGFLAALKRH